MDPAQAVVADIELAGVVADNHGVGQKAVGLDAAPQGALGGDRDRIGFDRKRRDAKRFQVRVPGRLIHKAAVLMIRQAGDHVGGKRALAHIGEGVVIDDVIVMAGPQQAEEIEPVLAARGAKPGEIRVADLGAIPIDRLVARPGVVHRDVGRVGKGGPQHVAGLVAKIVLAGDQQAHHLALGDHDADAAQQRQDARHRGLSLVIEHQHEAAQFGTEMAIDARRQRRRDDLPIRRLPTLAAELHHMGADHQVLHHVARGALQARAKRGDDGDDALLVDNEFVARAAAPALGRTLRRLRLGGLLHPARLGIGFDVGPPRTALQPRNLVPLRRDRSLHIRHFRQSLQEQVLQFGSRQAVNIVGW